MKEIYLYKITENITIIKKYIFYLLYSTYKQPKHNIFFDFFFDFF